MTKPSDPHLSTLQRALALQKAGQLQQAEDLYRQVLAVAPDHAKAHLLLGTVLARTDRPREAAAAFRDAVNLDPGDAMAYHNLANALREIGELQPALIAANSAIELQPTYVSAYCVRADILTEMQKYDLALDDYDRALLIDSSSQLASSGRKSLLILMGKSESDASENGRAKDLFPNAESAHFSVGMALHLEGKADLAKAAFQKAFDEDPGHHAAAGMLIHAKMGSCDWAQQSALLDALNTNLMLGLPSATPFDMLTLTENATIHRRTAELFFKDLPSFVLPDRKQHQNTKIKIAYVSADFFAHATAYLMAELFELHNRNKFEIYALSFSPNDRSPVRQRLEAAFDHFVEIGAMDDEKVVHWIMEEGIDILVDLKGITKDCRPIIFATRPAPVVVNYLGYPGTMGSASYDYIVGDPVVTPFEHADFYTEKIVQLPHAYQPNDRKRKIAPYLPSRASQGLPEHAFVFAAFNNSYKITPLFFDVWMRILKRVPNSVLWLVSNRDVVKANLRKEALARGVSPDRLVFADRLPNSTHLSRHRLADLFLDNLPYNAHTTTSDALWAGLPVLTCIGNAFAGRVAASLLTAVGLPELIARSTTEYEAKALWLAAHPEELAKIKAKLAVNRNTYPLFDAPRFTANLEKAFERMHTRAQQGLEPEAFKVEDGEPIAASVAHSEDSPVLIRG